MSDDLHFLYEFLVDPAVSSSQPEPIHISETMAGFIDSAEEREIPMVFAYLDEKNALRQTFRGSIHVHGAQQLAFWNRDPKGGFIRALSAGHDCVCATYREPDTPRLVHFHGRARLVEDKNEAARVWQESPELERQLMHGRNGVAVVIDLDRMEGIDQSKETGAWEPFIMSRA